MSPPLDELQVRIGHTFRQPALLTLAVTHPSWLPEHPEEPESNQRLEFLGDAVLQLILTEALFALYPGDREGALTQRRALLVRGVFLAGLARETGLDACLRLGTGEETSGGRTRAAALGDAFESLIGALYLDSDLATVRHVVLGLYGPLPDRLAVRQEADNPRGRLQERVQAAHGNDALRYECAHVAGDDHAREYEAHVFLHTTRLGSGRGPSKKAAEEAAARAALDAGRG